MSKPKPRALCPECGEPMRWDHNMKSWDCGPESEDGHGFWDPWLQGLLFEDGTYRESGESRETS